MKGEVALKITKRFLITDTILKSKGRERQELTAMLVERELAYHLDHFMLLYSLLSDIQNQSSVFQPFYHMLPPALPHHPIFWSQEDLAFMGPGVYQLQWW
jgi:hypothetical protein